jgi:hypothetical protein
MFTVLERYNVSDWHCTSRVGEQVTFPVNTMCICVVATTKTIKKLNGHITTYPVYVVCSTRLLPFIFCKCNSFLN